MPSSSNHSYWPVLLLPFLAGLAGTLVQFSLPAILPPLSQTLHLSSAAQGLVMSIFALATLFSALPAGKLSARHGVHAIISWGFFLLIIGSLVFFLAWHFSSQDLLWTTRVIQGIGFGLIAVGAPSALGQYVPPARRPWAMAIWATWVPMGATLAFFVGPRLFLLSHGPLAFEAGLIGWIGGIWILWEKWMPHRPPNFPVAHETPATSSPSGLHGAFWAAVSFAAFTFILFSLNTWGTTFFVHRFHWPLILSGDMMAFIT
ncbi:MAG: MFS transporter, partial [Firmicutes bacterium]|nr:MFS transporter [Bacillota bacterium]